MKEFNPKAGERYQMELVGIGTGVVDIIEKDGQLMVYEKTQGYYPVEYAKKRSDMIFTALNK